MICGKRLLSLFGAAPCCAQEQDDREMDEMIEMMGLRKPKHVVRWPSTSADTTRASRVLPSLSRSRVRSPPTHEISSVSSS